MIAMAWQFELTEGEQETKAMETASSSSCSTRSGSDAHGVVTVVVDAGRRLDDRMAFNCCSRPNQNVAPRADVPRERESSSRS